MNLWNTFIFSSIKVLAFIFVLGGHGQSAQAANEDWVIFRPQGDVFRQNQADFVSKIASCGGRPVEPTPGNKIFLIPVKSIACTQLTAKDELSKKVTDKALAPIKQIQKLTPAIGNLQLKELQQKFSTVDVQTSSYGLFESIISAPGSPRRHAINIPGTKQIIVNNAIAPEIMKSEFGEYFLVHEFLGAVGINDHNYSSSMSIWKLNKDPGYLPTLASSLPELTRGQKLNLNTSGTGTIVGGGGDLNEIVFKMSLLQATKTQFKTQDAAGRIQTLRFSEAQLTSAILGARISSMPLSFAIKAGLCKNAQGSADLQQCGGGTYDPKTQEFFILVADNWVQLANANQGSPLVIKVMYNLIENLSQKGKSARE